MRTPLALLISLLLGLGAAGLVACGEDDSGLIPGADAEAIKEQIGSVEAAVSDEDCVLARQAAERALDQAVQLPARVDRELRQRLNDGLRNLRAVAERECEEGQETTTPTIEETETEPETTTTEPPATEPPATEPPATEPPAEEPPTGGQEFPEQP